MASLQQLLLICAFLIQLYESTRNLTFFALMADLDGDTASKSIAGAQWLAIEEINNNPNLLPNYTLHYEVYNAGGNVRTGLQEATKIAFKYREESNENNTYFPIVLGAPWSSISTSTATVFSAFDMGQFSAGATSISLSSTSKYPYFYRTIPSDAIQPLGLIALCLQFGWDSIAVIYVDDAYGSLFALDIQGLALDENIDATIIPVTYGVNGTYLSAANKIKELGIYIIIIIVHSSEDPFVEFQKAGIVGYPYFYMGVDAWMDKASASKWSQDLTDGASLSGYIGTVPWQANSLNVSEYSNDTRGYVESAISTFTKLQNKWSNYWETDTSTHDHLYLEEPGSTMIYGYDAIYTTVYALDKIGEDVFMDYVKNGESANLIEALNGEISNGATDFVGATGHVIFDANGDRIDGLYSLGNILDDFSITYFGYFYVDTKGNLNYQIDESKIVWPEEFTEKGIRPQSKELEINEIKGINHSLRVVLYVFLALSLVITFIFSGIWIYFRKNVIIRAASWRLNLIMCFGAIMAYTAAILFGIDEYYVPDNVAKLGVICNVRYWMVCISFTIEALPLFMKTYRISQVFSEMLNKRAIPDRKLSLGVLFCITVDVLILSILTGIQPLSRQYIDGDTETIDEIRYIQYKYGECSLNNDVFHNLIFYASVLLWKLVEIGFGVHVTLDVAKISGDNVTNILKSFDETGVQILSIMITLAILIIVMTISFFGPMQEPNFFYSILSITIILVGNIVLFLNLLPRTVAVLTGDDENQYQLSASMKMKQKLNKKMKGKGRKISFGNNKKMSSIDSKTEASATEPTTTIALTQTPLPTDTPKRGINSAHSSDNDDIIESNKFIDDEEQSHETP